MSDTLEHLKRSEWGCSLQCIRVFCFEGEAGSTTGSLEPSLARAGLSPGREERMEENPSPGEVQEFRMGSGKCRWVLAGAGTASVVSLDRRE